MSQDEAPEDSSAIPGLHDLRQWREEVADDPVDPAPLAEKKARTWGEWDEAAIADLPAGAPSVWTLDDATPPPGEPLGKHFAAFWYLQRDDAMVLARPEDRRGLLAETFVVLGVSLGASALWSILSIINSLTMRVPLNQQTTSINNSVTPDRPWLDLLYQLYNIFIPLVPVALAFYLLARVRRPDGAPFRVMGLKWANAPKDTALGVLLAAVIGIPGLGLYVLARALGFSLNVSPANLAAFWWTVPVYILLAAMNGILEETVMIGYLFTRWTQIGWPPKSIILISALIRGSYHLYQGFGGFVGNFLMGALFGWVYMRTKRVLPLIIAHTILDIASFVGYALLKGIWTWL